MSFSWHRCLWRPRKHSRQTPEELISIGGAGRLRRVALATLPAGLVSGAKVDSAAVQDGFDLDPDTGSIVTNDGQWVVVQQGMNGDRKQARRVSLAL